KPAEYLLCIAGIGDAGGRFVAIESHRIISIRDFPIHTVVWMFDAFNAREGRFDARTISFDREPIDMMDHGYPAILVIPPEKGYHVFGTGDNEYIAFFL